MMQDDLPREARRAFYAIDEGKSRLASRFATGLTPDANDYHSLIDWACAGRSAFGEDPDGSGNDGGPSPGLALAEDGGLRLVGGSGVKIGGAGLCVDATLPLDASTGSLALRTPTARSGMSSGADGVAARAGSGVKFKGNALELALGDGLTPTTKVEVSLVAGGHLGFTEGAITVDNAAIARARSYNAGTLLQEIKAMPVADRIRLYRHLQTFSKA